MAALSTLACADFVPAVGQQRGRGESDLGAARYTPPPRRMSTRPIGSAGFRWTTRSVTSPGAKLSARRRWSRCWICWRASNVAPC